MARFPILVRLACLGLLLAAGQTVAAEEPAEAPSTPDAAQAFEYRGSVLRDGTAVGTFRLAADVGPLPGAGPEGTPRWRLREQRSWQEEDASLVLEATAWADDDLVPLEGTLDEVDAWGSKASYGWKRAEKTYSVTVRASDRTPQTREAPAADPALTTLAALVLHGRRAKADRTATPVHVWDPSWEYLEAERPFVAGTLTVKVDGHWQERPATVVTWASEGLRILVALTPEARDLLAVELRPTKGAPLLLRPGDPPESPADESGDVSFDAPATTPTACALRVALAFMTADVDLFDETIHWASLRKNHPGIVKGDVSDAEFRTAIRAQFVAKKQPPQPREQAEAFLRSIQGDLDVQPSGDAEAMVVLPQAFAGMRLRVGKVDRAWFLVRLPGT